MGSGQLGGRRMSPNAVPQYTRLVLPLPSPQNLLLSGEWKTLSGLAAVLAALHTSYDFAEKVARGSRAARDSTRETVP
jgi:hypothetical protein